MKGFKKWSDTPMITRISLIVSVISLLLVLLKPVLTGMLQ